MNAIAIPKNMPGASHMRSTGDQEVTDEAETETHRLNRGKSAGF